MLSVQFELRWSLGAQSALKKHKDASLASFVLCVDDNFAGGGTAFPWGPVERPKAGDAPPSVRGRSGGLPGAVARERSPPAFQ